MSTQQFNINSMFDLHRSFVAQQVEFTRDALEAQQQMIESASSGVEAWQSAAEQQAELARTTTENVLEQFPEQFEGAEQFETMIEESIVQFEQANEMGIEATEDAFSEASAAYGRFVESYLDALETGTQAYIEATETVEETTESVAEEIDVE